MDSSLCTTPLTTSASFPVIAHSPGDTATPWFAIAPDERCPANSYLQTSMPSPDSIESRIYEHVFGAAHPGVILLDTGVLSTEWTETYLELLKEAVQKCEGQDCLPREIVAAVHFASWYLNIRYDAWRTFQNGKRNDETDTNLARIRTPSECLLLSSVVEKRRWLQ